MTALLPRPTAPQPGIRGPRPPLGWRALLRLGRRDAVRHKGRAALVILLVAVPVAALFLGAVLLRSGSLSVHQRDLLRLGSVADALVEIDGNPAGQPALPAGWQRTALTYGDYGRVKLGGRYRFVGLSVGDLASPLVRGAIDVRAGRAPRGAAEAAVSAAVARKTGVRIGDTITVRRGSVRLAVVGLYEWANEVNTAGVVTAQPVDPTTQVLTSGTAWVKAPPGTTHEELVRVLGGAQVLTRSGFGRPTFAADGVLPVVALYTVGTIALFIVGIVVSAAFAVGARRQLRTLGLAAASGASPAQLRAAVTAQGVVTGAVGAVVGLALGAGGLAALAPHLNRLLGVRVPGLRVLPLDVALIACMAVATAALAAYLPARTAARVPTLAALGGRRPLRPVANGVPLLGAVLFGLGLLLLGVSVTGTHTPLGTWFRLAGSTILLLVGAVVCMPWFVGRLEPMAARLRGPARLAARGMARHRSRTGPIAAAILAAAGGAMAVATFGATRTAAATASPMADDVRHLVEITASDAERQGPPAIPPDVIARVAAVVSGAATSRLDWVTADRTGQMQLLTADTRQQQIAVYATDVASLRAAGLPPDAIEAFGAGRTLLADLSTDAAGRLTVRASRPDAGADARTVVLDVTPIDVAAVFRLALARCDPSNGCSPSPTMVVPDRVIDANGWERANATVRWRTAGDLTAAQQSALRRLAAAFADEGDERLAAGSDGNVVNLSFIDDHRDRTDWLQIILASLVTVAALGVTAVGLALSSAEGRSDDATLVALGAPPRVRRRVRAWEALFTAGLGCVLAVPLGFLPAAVSIANRHRNPIDQAELVGFPWRMALLIGVAVPLVAAAVAWATGRTRRRVVLRDE